MADSTRPSGVPRSRYCRQKRKGKPGIGYCRIDGHKVSLGRYGAPESLARYNELFAGATVPEDLGAAPPTEPAVTELLIQLPKWQLQDCD